MKIALFDFDGTITKKDTLMEFTRYAVGELRFLFGFALLLPVMISFKLKIITNHRAKEIFLSYFFKGWNKKTFEAKAKEYSLNKIDPILREKALERIFWHKEQGDRIIIVSASMEEWLKPWCDKKGLELLCTRFDIDSGKFIGNNCHGQEKVNRIQDCVNLKEFEYIYAYGDSSGDKQMLEIANEKFYKPFRV